MNSSVIEAGDLGAVSATMTPSRLRGPVEPVTTSSSTIAVPVDCASAWPESNRPVASAVDAQSARLSLIFMQSPLPQTQAEGPPEAPLSLRRPYSAKNQVVGDCFATVLRSLSHGCKYASVCL